MAAYSYALEQPIRPVYKRCRFWVISTTTADDLVARGISRDQIDVIYCGFNDDLLRPEPGLTKTSFPSVIYVGRLKKYKRVDLIIEAVARLAAKLPDLRLYVVGTGDREADLRRQVSALGIEKNVEFTGFVSETRKKELLTRSWVGAQTSTKEGWGLGVIEAAACGTPTVASESPGLIESVRANETGFLVPHGHVEALTEKLRLLLTEDALRTQYGAAACEWAQKFSWEEMARRSLEFIQLNTVSTAGK